MESEKLNKNNLTNRREYLCSSLVVFTYEFFCTFCLVGVVNVTKGNAAAVGLTLFFLLLTAGPITGGHFNPAVTLGVYINKVKQAMDDGLPIITGITFQAFNMILAQILGGLFATEIFFLILERKNTDGKVINKKDFPHLSEHEDFWEQAMVIEMLVAFIFISSILLVKDNKAGKYSATINDEGINFLGCGLIALSLTGMILVAGPHTGASINPAVSICQTFLASHVLGEAHQTDDFLRVYMAGPLLGAILAGFFSIAHAHALEYYGPGSEKHLPEPQNEEEAPAEANNADEEEHQLLPKENETQQNQAS